ncbi:MAG: hypothetical protein V4629_02995 [Pseudomonadota bacterium]
MGLSANDELWSVLERWLDADGLDFIEKVSNISQTWDDLIDKDKLIQDEDINTAFLDAIKLASHPFVQRFPAIYTVMCLQITTWLESNYIEQYQKHILQVSFVYRSAVTPIIMASIEMLRGTSDRRIAAREIYPLIFDETFEEYVKSVA